MAISNSFSDVISREVEHEPQLKGRLLPQLSRLRDEYQTVAKHCLMCAEETIFMDLDRVLAVILTREWSVGVLFLFILSAYLLT